MTTIFIDAFKDPVRKTAIMKMASIIQLSATLFRAAHFRHEAVRHSCGGTSNFAVGLCPSICYGFQE